MRAKGLLPILLLNIIVSVIVAFGIIAVFGGNSDDDDASDTPPLVMEVVVTATPDPNVTAQVLIITATPLPGTPAVVAIPDEALEGAGIDPATANSGIPAAPETTAEAPSGGDDAADTSAAALPAGCIYHTISDGDFPSSVALEYEVDFFQLMAVNGLDDDAARNLQIGDQLIVPLEGCPVEQFIAQNNDPTETPTPEPTNTPDPAVSPTPEISPTPSLVPTVTLLPTAVDSDIEIVEAINPGDITREAVTIRNNGLSVDVTGWTLVDLDGNTFTFPAVRLFSGAGVTINTRDGDSTSIVFYWGLDQAIFEPGDVITLLNADGEAQASYRVP